MCDIRLKLLLLSRSLYVSRVIAALGYDSYGESELFVPGWFGDASPDNSLHTVDNGRFAYLPVFEVLLIDMHYTVYI